MIFSALLQLYFILDLTPGLNGWETLSLGFNASCIRSLTEYDNIVPDTKKSIRWEGQSFLASHCKIPIRGVISVNSYQWHDSKCTFCVSWTAQQGTKWYSLKSLGSLYSNGFVVNQSTVMTPTAPNHLQDGSHLCLSLNVTFYHNTTASIQGKSIGKCHLQNNGYFISASMPIYNRNTTISIQWNAIYNNMCKLVAIFVTMSLSIQSNYKITTNSSQCEFKHNTAIFIIIKWIYKMFLQNGCHFVSDSTLIYNHSTAIVTATTVILNISSSNGNHLTWLM